MKALNDKEWEELQKRVKEMDARMGNLIGVNLFVATRLVKIEEEIK